MDMRPPDAVKGTHLWEELQESRTDAARRVRRFMTCRPAGAVSLIPTQPPRTAAVAAAVPALQ